MGVCLSARLMLMAVVMAMPMPVAVAVRRAGGGGDRRGGDEERRVQARFLALGPCLSSVLERENLHQTYDVGPST